jgi:peptide-methionine (S)-S-oxide reductase
MQNSSIAVLGAGCFWGVEAAFRQIEGVLSTCVGYSGGETSYPSYEEVCTGKTGHAEVVRVEFDPQKVSFGELLNTFWSCHDPTQLNRQGPDIGTQYRSVIFVMDEEQERMAKESKIAREASGRFPSPIVTAIEPFRNFYAAEEYHQQYLEKRGLASCRLGL